MRYHKAAGVSLAFLIALAPVFQPKSFAAEPCPGKSQDLNLKLSGSYKGKLAFQEDFEHLASKALPVGSELEFEAEDDRILKLEVSASLSWPFKPGSTYHINRHYFPTAGGAIQSLAISDDKGVLVSFSNSHGNPALFGLKLDVSEATQCAYPTATNAVKEGQARLTYQGKELAKLFAGQTGEIALAGAKYTVKMISAQLARQVNKNIAFEGTKSRVSYILVRK